MTAPRTQRRQTRQLLAIVSMIASGACDSSSSPATIPSTGLLGQGSAGVAATGASSGRGSAGQLASPPNAGSPSPVAGSGTAPSVAGAAGTSLAAAGVGAAGASTSDPSAGSGGNAGVAGDDSDAGQGGVTAAGSGGQIAAAGGGGGGSAAPSGGPTDPDQLGPYEVQLDQPVGEGFGVPVASSDTGDGVAGCKSFAESFGSDPADTMALIELPPDLRMDLYSLYRPATLEEGKKYPLITWGNGTCAKPEGYRTLLRHVASHGFFVIAANSRQVGQNSPMTKALDWAAAANDDPTSPYYGKIDLDKIGAMGHSQGGIATTAAARDKRVKAVIIWNGGASATKPFLAVSGDRDIAGSLSSYERGTRGATKGAYLWYHMVPGDGAADGHLTLMVEPERVVGPATAWFRYLLQEDPISRDWFVGDDCKLCKTPDAFEFGQKGL